MGPSSNSQQQAIKTKLELPGPLSAVQPRDGPTNFPTDIFQLTTLTEERFQGWSMDYGWSFLRKLKNCVKKKKKKG